MRLLVTGAAGFIGSNYVRNILARITGIEKLTILDKLTYAGSIENLTDVLEDSRVNFIKGDICDENITKKALSNIDVVVNFAAESHVDRSINSSREFINSNIVGVENLLSLSRGLGIETFIQISTDEVYGSILNWESKEEDALLPNSPYAASKAAADLIARSYVQTYGMDVRITRCVNNYGPFQNPEKFLPKAITNLLDGKKVPIYGTGENVREWIHVDDHVSAITEVLLQGKPGEIYNVGSGYRISNLELAVKLLEIMNLPISNLEFIGDRLGHDMRYALSSQKIISELGFTQTKSFEKSLRDIVDWYDCNQSWWRARISK